MATLLPRNVDDALRDAAARSPGRIFLRFADGDLTLAEVDRSASRIAAGLRGLGVRTGTHVAILMPNRAEYVLTWLAAAKLGAVAVPVNTQFRGAALAHVLDVTAAPVLVADPDLLEPVKSVAGHLRHLR